jgi:hypothetical protein
MRIRKESSMFNSVNQQTPTMSKGERKGQTVLESIKEETKQQQQEKNPNKITRISSTSQNNPKCK